MGEFAIGQAVSRFEDPRLLRGGGKYVDDIALPGMAFGHVLRSPHAHATIKSIDTTAAKAAPGVLCVLTGEDWIKSGWGDLPVPGTHKRRDGSTNYKPRYPALVKDRVRFVGDYVAFVVAETKNQAMDACELIEVEYETLPAGARHRRRRQARRDAGLGGLQGQHLLHRDPRRQGQDRRGLQARRPCGEGASRHQPRHHRVDGAARLGRRLQRHRRPLHASTPRCSARIPIAPSWPSSC